MKSLSGSGINLSDVSDEVANSGRVTPLVLKKVERSRKSQGQRTTQSDQLRDT